MNRQVSKALIMMLVFCFIFSTASFASAVSLNEAVQGYKDVPKDHYASKEIAVLSQRGIVQGSEDGTFKPDEEVTRGVTALWLSRALKLGKPASLKGFVDVPETSEYASAINVLAEKKIVQGDQGKFSPDASLTREQMASLLVRAFELKDNGINVWFKDEAAMGDSHFQDIIRLKQFFLTNQVEFMPKNKVTRAQLALFLYRAIMIGELETGQIPIEDFFRKSDVGSAQVSPNGVTYALLKSENNQNEIFVYTLGEDISKAVRITNSKDRSIEDFVWYDNNTIVYMTSSGGDEDYHIHSIQKDGTKDIDLTPYPKVKADILELYTKKPDYILFTMNKRSSTASDVYEMNILTGESKMIAENPGNITQWVTDLYGEVRMAMATEGTDTKMLYRRFESDPFETFMTIPFGDTFIPVMFSFDQSQLYALSNIGRDKLALVAYQFNTKSIVETIYENPEADITNIVVSFKKKAILAVEYETDKIYYHYMDDEFEKLNQEIAALVPGQQFRIVGNPLPDTKVFFRTYSDKSPGAYYYYNRKTKVMDKYADPQPWIKEEQMADMKPISYPSRDGRTIHGYLTMPKKVGTTNLPVVVLPHGGPWARDSWGYDPEVQLLANRGYAVLQVNFRGSTGYGKSFMNAGNKQWGRAMQDDITDGVQWLIKQGIADKERIAIYGASYGGYAALAGATYTPELYAAAVDYMGPSSMFTFLDSMPDYWEPDRQVMYERVGHPEKDKAMMEASSPLMNVDRIQAPIFFAQGLNDPRVNKKESDQMVMALRNRGIDSHYMVKNDEGHGFHKFSNKIDFYNALLKFLAIHLNNK
ncbi:S9 family peptidase [Paenibacillus sp. H1-7]|uniref:S9 family peptidase n=1 Tax=Paenibacillus sp. H1-7 TaxID=2282849 RepID=UPI001EF95809|nr:alpha/beta fold hydrolase [Paenibacillus sp. H1-7]ULL15389.1 S9 family peptidase [Paenibacillus sp. H1-7]